MARLTQTRSCLVSDVELGNNIAYSTSCPSQGRPTCYLTSQTLKSSPTIVSTPAYGEVRPIIFACPELMLYRLPRWVRDKSLSFVPPDGRFTLMEYRVATSSTSTAVAAAAPVPLPFALRASVRLDDTGGQPLRHVFPSKSDI